MDINNKTKIKPKFIFLQHFLGANIAFFVLIALVSKILPALHIFALVAMILSLLVSLYVKVLYQNTEYAFKEDNLSYSESFLNQSYKEIGYSRINEVHLVRGVWQRLFGLGTITLTTSATGDAGIRIVNIEDSKEYYDAIKELIHSYRMKNQR